MYHLHMKVGVQNKRDQHLPTLKDNIILVVSIGYFHIRPLFVPINEKEEKENRQTQQQ